MFFLELGVHRVVDHLLLFLSAESYDVAEQLLEIDVALTNHRVL